MIRSLVRLTAAVALASMLPATPHAASPSGLQYDEIVRVVSGATPPPPGNFQADLAAINSRAAVAATAAPRRHGAFGNLGALAGAIVSGNAAGAVAGAATDAVAGDALDAQVDRTLAQSASAFAGALHGLSQGRLERQSFYAGWERVDDVAAQTATITKCDLHQVIKLDLAKHTYSVYDPSAVPADTPAGAPKSRSRQPAGTPSPEQPGAAVADFSTIVTPLGARKLEGLDTTGYDDTSTFAISQATGSCRNGTFAFRSKAYYSRLATPRLVCPVAAASVTRQRYPQEPLNFVASGGCRPSFTAHRSGPTPPARNLSLYQTIALSGSAGVAGAAPGPAASPESAFVFLTERGNVHSLGPANAGLFEIPLGFTPAP
jgi:hypothetical protein